MSDSAHYRDVLRRIIQTGNEMVKIGQVADVPSSLSTSSTLRVATITITLPEPPSIYARLLDIGLQSYLASQLAARFSQNGLELRSRTEATIHRVCEDLAKSPRISDVMSTAELRQSVVTAYEKIYIRGLQNWAEEAISVARDYVDSRKHSGAACLRSGKAHRSFNAEYLPLLQHFFSENAYPTHADKAFLAKKSGMSFNQIHVWFQNHRRRAKKEGLALRKKPMREAPLSSFDKLLEDMGNRVIPEEDRKEYVDSDASEYECQYDSSDIESPVRFVPSRQANKPGALDFEAPPHAFPTAYPPPSDLYPFPIKDGIHNFAAPVWRRRSAQNPVEYTPIDLAEFIQAFANLNVREGPRKHWVKKQHSDALDPSKPRHIYSPLPKPDRSAATAAITTRLPPAPLQALVSTVLVTLPIPAPQIHTVPAPPSRLHAFKSPSPQSRLTTLVPPEQGMPPKNKRMGRRKVAPLPRRTPTGTKIGRREVTHADSEITVSPYSSPTATYAYSRASSFHSESSQPRSFSDASSISSEVLTPDSSLASLPEHSHTLPQLQSSNFMLPSNFSNLSSNAAQRDFLPVEKLPHGLQSNFAALDARKAHHFDFMPCAPPPVTFCQTVS